MFKSMTAFGRAHINAPICEMSVEITSLNRKTLDIRIHMPEELSQFDLFIRSLFDKRVERGTINVKIEVKWKSEHPVEVFPNRPLIKKYIEMRQAVEKEFDVESDPALLLNWVFSQKGTIVSIGSSDQDLQIQSVIEKGIQEALIPFFDMKRVEGYAIHDDVVTRLDFIERALLDVQQKAPLAVERYKDKLAKIFLGFEASVEDKERLMKEAALFADKVDIAEEIVRFHSHLRQFSTLSSGKTIDFLIQEMMREINTIGNKAQDHEVSKAVVLIKSELERIREQIQNVE